ncbi:hypothetical protein AB0I39_39950 [Kitasatospora purpeofusca]|uniref:hypothetical protein n=1 Tax=Kitasatospora purpeofusca TaxID=67352 RepID=UPI0033E4EF70
MALTRIRLSSGSSIELSDVRLSWTYGGFLEGYPFRRIIDLELECTLGTPGRPPPRDPCTWSTRCAASRTTLRVPSARSRYCTP